MKDTNGSHKEIRAVNNPWRRFLRIFLFSTFIYFLISVVVDLVKSGLALTEALTANISSSLFLGIFFGAFYSWWFRNHSFFILKEEYERDFVKVESAIARTGCTHKKKKGDALLYTPMPRKPYLLGAITIYPEENGYKIVGPHFYIDKIKKNLEL
ncbi:MAG: hypothetical protein WD077_03560 [Bacteroidia bacterium]